MAEEDVERPSRFHNYKKNPMKKLITIFFFSIICGQVFAQNNPIFYGGSGEGSFLSQYIQNYTVPQNRGGQGDGQQYASSNLSYLPGSNKGGVGHGEKLNTYLTSYIPKSNQGDTSDGYHHAQSVLVYQPKSNAGADGDGWASNYLVLGPLPIELLSFTGEERNNHHLLKWTTNMEKNSSHFNIEHSVDSRFFKEIGMTNAQGESSTSTNYEFVNKYPVLGDNYYRLKMIDLDGQYKYSNVILLRLLTNQSSIALFPNPSANVINLSFQHVKAFTQYNLSIQDMHGKTVWQGNHEHQGNAKVIDISNLASGMYLLHIKNMDVSETIKFRKE